jgi:hypothetical protein
VRIQRGIGLLARYAVALLMAFVVAGGPALASCDHGSHALLTSPGQAFSTDDRCPLCDRAMPDVLVPAIAAVPPSLEEHVLFAEGLAVRTLEPVDPLRSGRGPPRVS